MEIQVTRLLQHRKQENYGTCHNLCQINPMLYDFTQIPAADKKLLRLFAADKIQSFPFNTTYIIENGSSNNGSEGKTRRQPRIPSVS